MFYSQRITSLLVVHELLYWDSTYFLDTTQLSRTYYMQKWFRGIGSSPKLWTRRLSTKDAICFMVVKPHVDPVDAELTTLNINWSNTNSKLTLHFFTATCGKCKYLGGKEALLASYYTKVKPWDTHKVS